MITFKKKIVSFFVTDIKYVKQFKLNIKIKIKFTNSSFFYQTLISTLNLCSLESIFHIFLLELIKRKALHKLKK